MSVELMAKGPEIGLRDLNVLDKRLSEKKVPCNAVRLPGTPSVHARSVEVIPPK